MDANVWVEYAPIILIVVAFIMKNKIFVTPEQMSAVHAQILKEAEEKFLTLLEFNEYKKRVDDNITGIDNRLDNIDRGIQHITEILLKQKG